MTEKQNTGNTENFVWRGGSVSRWAGSFDLSRITCILTKLSSLIANDGKTRENLPEITIVGDNEKKEIIDGIYTITEGEIKKGLPEQYHNYLIESIKKLNDLGRTYKPKNEEEKVLCERLLEFNEVTLTPCIDDDAKTSLIIESPIRNFIKKYHTEILNVRKNYLGHYRPLKEKIYNETQNQYEMKYNNVESFLCSSKLRASEIKRWLRLFEDAVIKYPRLIHVVLEWPYLVKMPKLPRELLDYCQPEEYEYMLRRRKVPLQSDSAYSTLETTSTEWLVYPKGESWCKESGFKLFHELYYDIQLELNCSWELLLHSYGLTKSYGNNHHLLWDGWDGLFDDDYNHFFDEQGLQNGLYNCYYITDVFYESVRLCRYLLDITNTQSQQAGTTEQAESDREAPPHQKGNPIKLSEFLETYCSLNTKKRITAAKQSIREAVKDERITLPKPLNNPSRGQSHLYLDIELLEKWPEYRLAIPTLPAISDKKSVQK